MPTFEVMSPDGRKFEVNAPEGATQDDAIAYVQKNMATSAPKAAKRSEPEDPSIGDLASAVWNSKPEDWNGVGKDLVRYGANAGKGLFGLVDEAGAGIGAGLTKIGVLDPALGDPAQSEYDRRLANIRQTQNEFEQEHPGAAAVGQLSTGLIATAPLMSAKATQLAEATPVVGRAAQAINGIANPTLRASAQAASTGAGLGAVSGFGSGEGGFANRALNAGKDAVAYGVAGGLIPPVIAGAGKVISGAGMVAGTVGGAVKGAAGKVGSVLEDWYAPERAAARQVGRALAADATPINGQAQAPLEDVLAKVRAGMTPAEAGGSNIEALTDAIAQQPGPARPYIQQMMDQRVAQQGEDIPNAIMSALGTDGEGTNAIEMAKAAKAKVRPLAEKAFAPFEAPVEERSVFSLRPEGRESDYYYHATPLKNIDGIKSEGLRTSKSNLERTSGFRANFFSKSIDDVDWHVPDADAPVMRVKRSYIRKLGHAEDTPDGKVHWARDRETPEIRVDADIPPEKLEVYSKEAGGWIPLEQFGMRENLPPSNPVGADPVVQRLLQNNDVKAGIPRGVRIIRNEADAAGEPFSLQDYGLVEINPGVEDTLQMQGVPNMRLIDAAKRGLDAMINENSNQWGHLNDLGRSQYLLKKALVDRAKELNPAYADYLNTAASEYSLQNAAKLGRGIWRTGNKEETITQLADLSAPEKKMALQGAVRGLLEEIEKKPESANLAATKLTKPYYRDLLSPLVDDPKQLDTLVGQLQEKSQAFLRNRTWLQQSRTALRQEYGKGAPTSLMGMLRDTVFNSPEVRDRTAQMLLNNRTNDSAEILQKAYNLANKGKAPQNFVTNPARVTPKMLEDQRWRRAILEGFYAGSQTNNGEHNGNR